MEILPKDFDGISLSKKYVKKKILMLVLAETRRSEYQTISKRNGKFPHEMRVQPFHPKNSKKGLSPIRFA